MYITAKLNRGAIVKAAGIGAMAAFTQPVASVRGEDTTKVNGHIKQSVCQWCYNSTPLPKLAEEAKRIGYKSVELLTPDRYKIVRPFGLTCAMLERRVHDSRRLQPEEKSRPDRKIDPRTYRVRGRQRVAERHLLSGNRRGMATMKAWRTVPRA